MNERFIAFAPYLRMIMTVLLILAIVIGLVYYHSNSYKQKIIDDFKEKQNQKYIDDLTHFPATYIDVKVKNVTNSTIVVPLYCTYYNGDTK